MRRMYDSVNAAAIPTDAEMVAGYVDGKFAWTAADWARFPNSVKVRISAIGATHLAEVFDVEVGCIWPPRNVVPLVVRARAAGIDPTVYVNQHNDWGPTKAAFDAAGVAHPHWWVANYDGVQSIPAGSIAKQYAHPGTVPGKSSGPWETGKHYDLSVVADHWPGVDNQNGDDVSFNDQITNHAGATFSAAQWLTWGNEYAAQGAANSAALLDKVDALAAVVAADKDVSVEELRRIVDDAVKANSAAQAKLVAQQTVAELRVAVREEMGTDNQDQADAIVDAVAARLAGAK
ncbi:MAG TPA: hypothetical protein VNO31_02910 [Umezawaea sp.]|nr:hypothetical protein [Umezawaea sp.]